MKRSAPPRRRTPLKRMSAKRAAIAPKRRAFVAELLERRPTCEFPTRIELGIWFGVHFVPCGQPAVDCHEPLTRARGGSILDENNTVVTCRKHHEHLHSYPEWSAGIGLLKHSWDAQVG